MESLGCVAFCFSQQRLSVVGGERTYGSREWHPSLFSKPFVSLLSHVCLPNASQVNRRAQEIPAIYPNSSVLHLAAHISALFHCQMGWRDLSWVLTMKGGRRQQGFILSVVQQALLLHLFPNQANLSPHHAELKVSAQSHCCERDNCPWPLSSHLLSNGTQHSIPVATSSSDFELFLLFQILLALQPGLFWFNLWSSLSDR